VTYAPASGAYDSKKGASAPLSRRVSQRPAYARAIMLRPVFDFDQGLSRNTSL